MTILQLASFVQHKTPQKRSAQHIGVKTSWRLHFLVELFAFEIGQALRAQISHTELGDATRTRVSSSCRYGGARAHSWQVPLQNTSVLSAGLVCGWGTSATLTK